MATAGDCWLRHLLPPSPDPPARFSVSGSMQTSIRTLQSLMKFVLTPKSKVMRRKLVHSLTRQSRLLHRSCRKTFFFYRVQISIKDIEPAHPPITSSNRRSDLRSFTTLITARVSCISGKTILFHKGKRVCVQVVGHVESSRLPVSPKMCSLGSRVCFCTKLHIMKSWTVSAGILALQALLFKFTS